MPRGTVPPQLCWVCGFQSSWERRRENTLRKGSCKKRSRKRPHGVGWEHEFPRHRTETSPRETDSMEAVVLLPPAAAKSRWAHELMKRGVLIDGVLMLSCSRDVFGC